LFDVYCLAPGQAQKVHVHDDIDKVYVAHTGRVVAILGDEERTLGPGQAAHAPAGVAHGLRNDSGAEATVLVFQAR
jgi:mannose-6-phosphate isomerase-like protein (cupin superfamily)